MEAVMGGMSLGGQLKRLEEDYDLVKKKRPILSKEGSQTVRYEVLDMFLRFWFRYFIKYQNYIEIQNFERLADIIKKDYPTFSGLALEMYFRQQMMESKEFADIGSWWQGKNNKEQDEIDIVGLYAEEKKALVAEVKRQSKNFKPDLFALKVEELRKKVLFKYEIESRLFLWKICRCKFYLNIMITKIDIERFGLFSNYCWKQHIGTENNHIFSKMNIIYGRNYSGKTTLSRIFRCIEMKQLHNNYHNGIFAITTDNSTITNTNLVCSDKVKVYNTDFVRENLSWLSNEEGDIKPFTLLGSNNVKAEKRITEINEVLGGIDAKKGYFIGSGK